MPDALSHEIERERERSIRALPILSIVYFVVVATSYVLTVSWSQPFPRDATTMVVGRDFMNFWMYGRAATMPNPALFYDVVAYNQELTALLGPNYPPQNWSYLPNIMILAAPFGQLSYLHALLCWLVLSAVLFWWAVKRHLSDPRLLLAQALAPAAIFCVISGQNSLLTTAMIVAVFACLDRRPICAGVLIGLLTLKPQLGLLFPFMLAATGRWRVIVTATITALAVAGLTTVFFGTQVWVDFVREGLPVQAGVLADSNRIATPFYPTIFMNLRGIDASYQLAIGVQACFSAFAVAAILWAYWFRRNADPQILMALFLSCAVFASPYLLVYDTLPLTFAVLLLLADRKLDKAGIWFAKLVYWLPLFQLVFGYLHIPGPALIAPALAIYLLTRLSSLSDQGLGSVSRPPGYNPAAAR